MTTNLSTNSLQADAQPEFATLADANGLPDPAALARLANALFAAPPGGTPATPKTESLPDEAVLRTLPAALAGATGPRPETVTAVPSSEAVPYFLKTAQPTSENVLPTLQPDHFSFDPTLSSSVSTLISTTGPRAQPNRSGLPGPQPASLPVTPPGGEMGSVPLAGAISPASVFDLPGEAALFALPAVLAGLTRTTPPVTPAPDASLYFLDPTAVNPQRTLESVDLTPRSVEPEPLNIPVLDWVPGLPREVPASRSTATAGETQPRQATGSAATSTHDASEKGFYFLDESKPLAEKTRIESGHRQPDIETGRHSAHPGLDVAAIRRDFPILAERVNGKPLIWLDNAATTQKPQAVIDRLAYFYQHENSNIHRAAHELAARATDAYEAARDKVARFLRAGSSDEIVFVRGTTEAINLIAQSWGRRNIGQGDEIIISWLEHHANIVPWQQLCQETGARLRVAPVDASGQILLDEYEKLFNARTRLVSFTQVSNALGTVTPAQQMVEIAHRHGVRVLVDGAQAISHMAVDVKLLDCDWYVFSGHKVFGPTGIGVVYGKQELLDATPPWQGGGNMIQDVTFEKTVYQPAPARFEAGTGNIADAVGLGAALDYVTRIGMENIARYEHDLLVYATRGLETVPGLRLIGTAQDKASVLSFVLPGFRTEEVGAALNRDGIAVRSGHHCAQPILRRFGLEATVRPSLAFYNTCEEVDALIASLLRLQGGSHSLRQ